MPDVMFTGPEGRLECLLVERLGAQGSGLKEQAQGSGLTAHHPRLKAQGSGARPKAQGRRPKDEGRGLRAPGSGRQRDTERAALARGADDGGGAAVGFGNGANDGEAEAGAAAAA